MTLFELAENMYILQTIRVVIKREDNTEELIYNGIVGNMKYFTMKNLKVEVFGAIDNEIHIIVSK